MNCPVCNEKLENQDVFCGNCGADLRQFPEIAAFFDSIYPVNPYENNIQPKKSKLKFIIIGIIAGLLVLGGIVGAVLGFKFFSSGKENKSETKTKTETVVNINEKELLGAWKATDDDMYLLFDGEKIIAVTFEDVEYGTGNVEFSDYSIDKTGIVTKNSSNLFPTLSQFEMADNEITCTLNGEDTTLYRTESRNSNGLWREYLGETQFDYYMVRTDDYVINIIPFFGDEDNGSAFLFDKDIYEEELYSFNIINDYEIETKSIISGDYAVSDKYKRIGNVYDDYEPLSDESNEVSSTVTGQNDTVDKLHGSWKSSLDNMYIVFDGDKAILLEYESEHIYDIDYVPDFSYADYLIDNGNISFLNTSESWSKLSDVKINGDEITCVLGGEKQTLTHVKSDGAKGTWYERGGDACLYFIIDDEYFWYFLIDFANEDDCDGGICPVEYFNELYPEWKIVDDELVTIHNDGYTKDTKQRLGF